MGRLATLCFIVLQLSACSEQEPLQLIQGHAQGTSYEVRFYARRTAEEMDRLSEAITRELESIDAGMSGYRADSTIEQFNSSISTRPQNVGSEIVALVEIASEINQVSSGCYDLTVKPLFQLWGFVDDHFVLPDPLSVQAVMNRVGMSNIGTSGEDKLYKLKPAVEIDLSSIAQGYTAGRLARILEQSGIRSYMVEIGGEIMAAGTKPDAQPWRIAIERPVPGDRRVEKIFSIKGGAVAIATSGTYRHFFDEEGTRYSHILDARTGYPVTHDTVSVTVVHSDGAYADAWSTALLCLGAEEGVRLADENRVAALFIQQNEVDLNEIRTRALRNHATVEIQ